MTLKTFALNNPLSIFGFFNKPSPPPSKMEVVQGHAYRVLRCVVWAPAVLMGTADGMDKSAKLANSILMGLKLYYKDAVAPAVHILSHSFKVVENVIGGRNIFERVKEGAEFADNRLPWSREKLISRVFLTFGHGCEFFNFCKEMNIAQFAMATEVIGNSRFFGFLAHAGLRSVKDHFIIGSCIFGLIEASNQIEGVINKKKGDSVKPWLSVAGDVGKIGCCLLTQYMATYVVTWAAFAWFLFTGISQCSKILWDAYLKDEGMKRILSPSGVLAAAPG